MYNLSDNICCSVHTLLWTAAARIFVALDFVQLHKIRLPQSIQRWTFCKEIVLPVICRKTLINEQMYFFLRFSNLSHYKFFTNKCSIFFGLCFSAIKNNKLKSAIYSLMRIFNHILHYFLLAVIPANFTFCSCF